MQAVDVIMSEVESLDVSELGVQCWYLAEVVVSDVDVDEMRQVLQLLNRLQLVVTQVQELNIRQQFLKYILSFNFNCKLTVTRVRVELDVHKLHPSKRLELRCLSSDELFSMTHS